MSFQYPFGLVNVHYKKFAFSDPANITHINGNQTVNETDVVTLTCKADGYPTPGPVKWTRVSDNSPVSFPLTITGKQDEGGYRCTADNGIGNPASQVVYIIVKSKSKLYTLHVYHGLMKMGIKCWTKVVEFAQQFTA